MTTTLRARPARPTSSFGRPSRTDGRIVVEILVCGSVDRGDDGAPLAAVPLIRRSLPADVRLKVVGMLDIDDLLAIAPGAGAVIVDAAVGIPPGQIVTLPLAGFIGHESVRPRSSHALAFPEVIGLAELMRGGPVMGQVVAIGTSRFGPGKPLSRLVAVGLPSLAGAVLDAVEHTRQAIAAAHRR